MKALKLSSKVLSLKVGVSKGSVSHWTSGANKTGGERLIALAKALECDAAWLATGEGHPTPTTAISTYGQASIAGESREATTAIILELLKKHAGKSLNAAAKLRVAEAVAESLETSLYKVRESAESAAAQLEVREGDICIPHLDLKALEPHGKLPADYSEAVRSLTVSESFLREQGLRYTSADQLAVVTQWGQGMEGTINDRDPVIVDCGVNEFGGEGLYVVSWRNHLYIKRVQMEDADYYKLISDNAKYENQKAGIEDVVFHAKVLLIWSVRKV
ncbi:S24 family peptidase [Metapseudomonas resinovorans]|nr:S24 family peptidase [Pseudomonas resinovorans]